MFFFFFPKFRLCDERLNSTPCQIVCLLSSETWQNLSAGQLYKASLTPCPETNSNNSPRETGCSWEKLDRLKIFWKLTPTFRGLGTPLLLSVYWVVIPPGCFTEGCRLLSTENGPWSGVGWRTSLGTIDLFPTLQVAPMMELRYKNGFVGPRFMTLEVGFSPADFFEGDENCRT